MFRKKSVALIFILVSGAFFFTLHNLLLFLPGSESEFTTNLRIENEIYAKLRKLPDIYKNVPQVQVGKADIFLKNLGELENFDLRDFNLNDIWHEANLWPSANQLTNISSPNIGKLIHALKYAKITNADIDTRGTQLKILLTLKGGQLCVFKPQWYEKERVIEGPVFAGKDRYGSEIVAFYLSILLDKPLTPVSVERTISLKYDILPVASQRLIETSFERSNRTCVYGKCFYCRKEDPVCENKQNKLSGAVIFNVRKSFSNYRSPWQRTYKNGKLAPWEINVDFCRILKNRLNRKRIFDLIDTAIFDFLLQNGDRHHYETLEEGVVWVDNGKGFGNPYVQHLDILAPLYQCCVIRGKTWKALLSLAGGNLSKYMKLMPDIENILTDLHLQAMEERLQLIFATVEYCKSQDDN